MPRVGALPPLDGSAVPSFLTLEGRTPDLLQLREEKKQQ
mgnify:CR=1 FL=1